MPSRHIEKLYAEDTFYHVFNRGVEKRNIFLDDDDYRYFLYLFNRYLGSEAEKDSKYRLQPNFSSKVDLVAYCLMPNHFHMLVFQKDKDGMQQFMRSLGTAYTMYFNKKYKRVGSLFQDRYKAVMINQDNYYTHISRYIHLNPIDIGADYLQYPYSSLSAWSDKLSRPSWLKPERASNEFKDSKQYLDFLAEYKDIKIELQSIKESLKE